MTDPKIEAEEQATLEAVQNKLEIAYEALGRRVHRYAQDIKDQKTYLWDNRSDMDHAEKVSTRQAAQQMVQSGEVAEENRAKIAKLIQSPWFGRIDFRKSQTKGTELSPPAQLPIQVYVGIHSFADEETGAPLIYDWRAPVSTMFYDYELGPAKYESPGGTIDGELLLKRQFRIRNGKMEFMLESGLNIMDDVLQEELSRTSDDRMKNIVATIQRDQNAIILNEHANVLIIQGVAGSGKTSIALHRIAFLLYRHRDTLRSNDILIISPNKVFGDFISNVLPELGEEQIAEMGMDQLANELLDRKVKFQTFFEQTATLLEKGDADMQQRIAFKATVEFVKSIEKYVRHVESTRFTAADVWVGDYAVPAWVVEKAFNKRPDLPLTRRVKWAAEVVEQEIWVNYRYEISTAERAELKKCIAKMYKKSTVRALYKEMFEWMGRPELFKVAPRGRLEYADVFPLIYLKILLEGMTSPRKDVRHLLVDEMQDYTPVQYAVLSRLFPCDKTILGDAHQSVNPFSSSRSETISAVFKQAETVQLQKSYRSSFEITQFASDISNAQNIVAIQRHGKTPEVIACKSKKMELVQILDRLQAFNSGNYQTLGIICKTQKQAEKMYKGILESHPDANLLTPLSTVFKEGITVCSAHFSKGLEFDHVIVPDVTLKNYASEMDRHLLYVAATRAMHELTLTHYGPVSHFVPKTSNRNSPKK